MENKTPEEQAAELYPITDSNDSIDRLCVVYSRNAWLSRQAEVDELKRKIKSYSERLLSLQDKIVSYQIQLAAKTIHQTKSDNHESDSN